MKKLVCVIGFMTVASSAHATISIVHVSSAVVGSNPRTIHPPATSTGNLLVMCIELGTITRTIKSIKDNGSPPNVYTKVDAATSTNTVSTQQVYIYYSSSAVSMSSATVTLTNSGNIGELVLWELSGAAATVPLDVGTSSGNYTASTTLVGAPLTSIGPNEFVAACNSAFSFADTGVQSPYTFDLNSAGGHGSAHHISATQIVGERVTFTLAGSGTGAVSMAAFCPSGGCSAASGGISPGKIAGLSIRGGKTCVHGGKLCVK